MMLFSPSGLAAFASPSPMAAVSAHLGCHCCALFLAHQRSLDIFFSCVLFFFHSFLSLSSCLSLLFSFLSSLFFSACFRLPNHSALPIPVCFFPFPVRLKLRCCDRLMQPIPGGKGQCRTRVVVVLSLLSSPSPYDHPPVAGFALSSQLVLLFVCLFVCLFVNSRSHTYAMTGTAIPLACDLTNLDAPHLYVGSPLSQIISSPCFCLCQSSVHLLGPFLHNDANRAHKTL